MHPVGHPSRLGARGLPAAGCASRATRARATAPTCTCTRTRRWRSRTCATSPACRRPRCSRGSPTPAWARRPAPPPRCSTTACASGSARTSCRSRAGWRSSRPAHRAGVPSTSTVMFGHIEEPWELAEHLRVIRDVQERTGGITEFVPLSFIPFHTLLGRTHGIEEISREENLKHTAVFRLALGRSDHQSAGELGQDGPRRRDRGPALGRQRSGRNPHGGEHQPARRELPRRATGSAGSRRPPRTAPAGPPPSARRSTRSASATRVGVLPESPLDQVATGDVGLEVAA